MGVVVLRGLVPLCILWSCVNAQIGPEDCIETVAIDQKATDTPDTIYVSSGIVCIECIINGTLATDAVFPNRVDGEGIVEDGILVVFDSESFFSTAKLVICFRNISQQYGAQVSHRILRAPVIRGETTISEGDTLKLDCDAPDSRPLPSVQWFFPGGEMMTITQQLKIENITRNLSGNYTCVASQTSFNGTTSSSVEVTVNLKCRELMSTDMIIVNTTSTTVGSTATYQCRDGSTDVYTTLCTSHGVWDTDPFSSLRCVTEPPTTITTDPVSCDELNSTDQIIVKVTSTTSATYRCRVGSTDVYTTLCTSHGVWDPDPFSSIKCSSSEEENGGSQITVALGVFLPILLILSITTVIIVLFALKKLTRFKLRNKRYKSRHLSKSGEERTLTTTPTPTPTPTPMEDPHTMTMGNALYSEILPPSHKTTELNGRYSLIQENPLQTAPVTETNRENSEIQTEEPSATTTQPFPLYSVVQKKPKTKAMPQVTNALYSVVQKKPKTKAMPQVTNALYSVVQKKPKRTKDVHSTGELPTTSSKLEDHIDLDKENEGQLPSRESHSPSPPPPPIPPYTPLDGKTIVYAEVGPHVSTIPLTLDTEKERVQYATLDHNAMLKSTSTPAAPQTTTKLHTDPDSTVCLDQILIQLEVVAPKWRELGETVGVGRLNEISECVSTDAEAMVEVVDGWLAKLHPKKPTWREIADVVEGLGHHILANALREVYISGVLPVEVSNALPTSLTTVKEPPPPLPPRETNH